MRTVPGWALASAIAAPVAMIGGWTLAAARQPSFDPTTETISALAATTATDAWIMTAGLALTGVAHLVTAAGLRPLRRAGRVLLALGGAATLAVAALPSDVAPHAHGVAATIGFGALALWPALAARRGPGSCARPSGVGVRGARRPAGGVRRRARARRRRDRARRAGARGGAGALAAGRRRRPAPAAA